MADAEFASFAREVVQRARSRGALAVLNGPFELARAIGADGVHLRSAALARAEERPPFEWVGASCHDRSELERAAGARLRLRAPRCGEADGDTPGPAVARLGGGRKTDRGLIDSGACARRSGARRPLSGSGQWRPRYCRDSRRLASVVVTLVGRDVVGTSAVGDTIVFRRPRAEIDLLAAFRAERPEPVLGNPFHLCAALRAANGAYFGHRKRLVVRDCKR